MSHCGDGTAKVVVEVRRSLTCPSAELNLAQMTVRERAEIWFCQYESTSLTTYVKMN